MKIKIWIIALTLALAAWARGATNDLTSLLQQGLFEEEANRNLDAAIADYQSLASAFDKDRQLAATAVFRLGECYRKLGKTNEAVIQYQRVIKEFDDQPTLVTLSRQNLAGLNAANASYGANSSDPSPQNQSNPNAPVLLRLRLQRAAESLSRDQARLQELLTHYLPTNSQVVSQQRQIEADQTSMAELIARLQSVPTSPDAEAASTGAVTDEEQTQIRNIQAMIRNSPDLINAPGPGADGDRTPLQQAAEKGQLVVAKYLLDHGAVVDATSSGNAGQLPRGTPLYLAANYGHKAMVELLLAHGADPNGGNSLNPLYTAVSHGFSGVAEVLIANKADVNSRGFENNRAPLHAAVSNDKTNLLQSLIEHGADVNAKDANSQTPLNDAARLNEFDAVKILLAAKADVNARDKDGNTPLHNAAWIGSEKITSLLLDSGASVDATNHFGTTPLLFACVNGRDAVVRVLLAHKADPNLISRPDQNYTPGPPVLFAASRNDPAIVQMLLEAGANPNGDTNTPWHPIFSTLRDNGATNLALLLQHGADPNAPNNQHLTPLFLTTNPELVHLLIDYKADLNARDPQGETPVMRVTSSDGRIPSEAVTNFTKILLDAGAKTDLQDTNGNTALHFAVYYSRPESVALLLEHKANPNIQNNNGYTPLDVAKQGMTGQVTRNWLTPNFAAEIRGTTPGTYSKMAEWLTTAGGLANLPKRDRIEVRRGATTRFMIYEDSQGRNRYSLFEVIALSYNLLAQQPSGNWHHSNIVRPEIFGNNGLPFPDFKKVVIYRSAENSPKQTAITADLENALHTADCSRDRMLEWGDVVEIPEADHPVDLEWQGLSDELIATLTNCVGREVTVKINNETIKLKLAPEFKDPPFISLIRASFMLRSVLDNAGLIRVSSDLSHVKVTRVDPETKKTREWIIDCTNERQADLWLRDGDVIEVPEK